MGDRFITAGLRQTDEVRGRLRRLGPLALPVAVLLTLPCWALASSVVSVITVWKRLPGLATAVLIAAVCVGLALGALVIPGA